MNTKKLQKLARLVRYYILISTTKAGSGHPTSSLSAADLMTVLMFGGFFKADLDNPDYPENDRLIFSKGHASPLFYSLYAVAGKVSESELKSLRKFGSRLEGHPTMEFPYTEAATGSLGQGLSIGLGMALNAKSEKLNYKTFVLLGDSEMAEGSVWEALALASHYKLENLIGIIDINRLGQRGETLYGHDLEEYSKKVESFGWRVLVIDGHSLPQIIEAFKSATSPGDRPVMIIAKTFKGKGISFLEDKEGWHGKAVPADQLDQAVSELGAIDRDIVGKIPSPKSAGISKSKLQHAQLASLIAISKQSLQSHKTKINVQNPSYKQGEMVATRKAYGNALLKLVKENPDIVVLDAEVSNSTMSDTVKKENPSKFFEMFIAEQNMVGAALGFSRRGKIPFVSTFAAFFSRAFDQIRMSQYSNPNIKFVGSHAGVSIGEDGASQMALEDIAMFRSVHNSVVLYPSDAVSAEKLTEIGAAHQGNVYIRTTRAETPVLYDNDEEFKIGGFKIHKFKNQDSKIKNASEKSKILVIGAGITLYEALKAQEQLAIEDIGIDVVDLYSIKPLDSKALLKLAEESKSIITVEDHYPEGGIGEAVKSSLAAYNIPVYSLAVNKIPHSGKPAELLGYEEIDSASIIKAVKQFIK